MSKENVYDELVNPLMTQIIKICQENEIAFVANFELDDDLRCTTVIPAGADKQLSDTHKAVVRILQPPRTTHMTATMADGSKTLIAIVG